ncbi:MAG: hypothetical protein ACTSQE_07290 [Candidatus Heimdallarchaeaceae archaeon]
MKKKQNYICTPEIKLKRSNEVFKANLPRKGVDYVIIKRVGSNKITLCVEDYPEK